MQAIPTNVAKYTRKRLVVLSSSTSVYDAVRALEANHIGAIVVEDGQRVVGIVTDRDIALRVIGHELDPTQLTLRHVMTRNVATLPLDATDDDAARVMLDRHVRRIPIVDGTELVGLVTLDDLVLAEYDARVLAHIVRAQLSEPAALKDKGDVHPTAPVHGGPAAIPVEERAQQRHAARARFAYVRFIRRVLDDTGLETAGRAEIAVETFLEAIVQRITAQECEHLMAQLPTLLRERLAHVPRGRNRSTTRQSLERALADRLDLAPARAAQLVERLGHALELAVSHGEVSDVRAQLPADMSSIFC